MFKANCLIGLSAAILRVYLSLRNAERENTSALPNCFETCRSAIIEDLAKP